MHHRPSRCCMCAMVTAATSDRRRAQPRSTAMMARSRRPLVVVMSGALRSAWACLSESQLPARTPMDLALFTLWMPAACSGASSPLSVASTASLRIADIRTMMDDDPRPRSSRDTRHAFTVLQAVNAPPGVCVNPGDPGCIPGAANGGAGALIDPAYKTPYALHASAGVQHAFGSKWMLSADWTHEAGVHAYRRYQYQAGYT